MTITATSYGGFGQVEETLPHGFSYTGSNLSEDFVTEEEDGQTVSFVLLGDRSFTYTVEVSDVEDTYTFSGVLKDANKDERVIGGASQVLVGPEPTATPTSEPTATPTPTLGPTATAAQSAPFPVSEDDTSEEAGGPGLLPIIMGGVVLLSTGFIVGFMVGRRRAG